MHVGATPTYPAFFLGFMVTGVQAALKGAEEELEVEVSPPYSGAGGLGWTLPLPGLCPCSVGSIRDVGWSGWEPCWGSHHQHLYAHHSPGFAGRGGPGSLHPLLVVRRVVAPICWAPLSSRPAYFPCHPTAALSLSRNDVCSWFWPGLGNLWVRTLEQCSHAAWFCLHAACVTQSAPGRWERRPLGWWPVPFPTASASALPDPRAQSQVAESA